MEVDGCGFTTPLFQPGSGSRANRRRGEKWNKCTDTNLAQTTHQRPFTSITRSNLQDR